jgi:hypothetical protein
VLAGGADGMKPIVRALLAANDELNEEEATVPEQPRRESFVLEPPPDSDGYWYERNLVGLLGTEYKGGVVVFVAPAERDDWNDMWPRAPKAYIEVEYRNGGDRA